MTKVVSVVGATLTGNSGAEAMLSAVAFGVRGLDGSATVHVHSYYPDEDRTASTAFPVRIHSARPADLVLKVIPQAVLHRYVGPVWRRLPETPTKAAVRSLAESDLLACVAGVSFVDGRRPFLAYNVATLLPAIVLGVPVIKFSQAMGPFRDPVTRTVARIALGRVHAIVPRGGRTEESVRSLNLRRPRVHPASDLAFSLKPGSSLVERSQGLWHTFAQWRDAGAGDLVAVSPSSVLAGKQPADSQHRRLMASVISHLVSGGYRVVVIPTATRHALDSTHNNDLPLLRAIREGATWPEERVFWAEATSSFADVTAIVAPCDALVASRFHAMIAGLSAGVPTLVLGWGHKYREVLSAFGLERYSLSGETLGGTGDIDDLLETLDEFLGARPGIAAAIEERREAVVDSSRGQLELLTKV